MLSILPFFWQKKNKQKTKKKNQKRQKHQSPLTTLESDPVSTEATIQCGTA